LSIEDGKIKSYKIDRMRLSDKIPDDKNISAILPRCFTDSHCRREGFIGACLDAGSVNSTCSFTKAKKVSLQVITTKECLTCNTQGPVDFLKKQFPGLEVSYLYYPGTQADKLVNDFSISGLPAYLLGKEAQNESGFEKLKIDTEEKGDFYILKPQFTGIGYFIGREKIPGKLDLFFSLYDKNSLGLLEAVKEFNPKVHFLAVDLKDGFDSPGGLAEVEEDLRLVCVQKYYPDNFWDYISCRMKSINSSWWEDCLSGLDANKIRLCAKGPEGSSLLKENIRLNKEIHVMSGPTYLVDNQEVFSSQGVPAKEELRKIIKR